MLEMPRLQVLAASTGHGLSNFLNFYLEDLGEAGATAQCALRELWLCGHLPECVMVGLKHLGHGVLRRDSLLPVLCLFDRHPHLQFIHCCISPDLAHPAGGSPDCSPAAAPPSWLTAAGSPSSCCCRLS